jgi:hypothetical protein
MSNEYTPFDEHGVYMYNGFVLNLEDMDSQWTS